MLAACGGGSDPAPQGVAYQGKTAAATITTSNAETLALDSFRGADLADGFSGVTTAAQQVQVATAVPGSVDALRVPLVANAVKAARK